MWKQKYIDFGKVVAVLTLVLCIMGEVVYVVTSIKPKKLEVSFLDVGQGDAIFIKTPSGKEMIIDGGPNAVVIDRLHKRMSYFDKTISIMVATHPDADHVTGLIDVLRQYDVSTILLSGKESDTAVYDVLDTDMQKETGNIITAQKGMQIDFGDGVVAHVLHPLRGVNYKDTNDASVSMIITYGSHSFLVGGDLPSTYEKDLMTVATMTRNTQEPNQAAATLPVSWSPLFHF